MNIKELLKQLKPLIEEQQLEYKFRKKGRREISLKEAFKRWVKSEGGHALMGFPYSDFRHYCEEMERSGYRIM